MMRISSNNSVNGVNNKSPNNGVDKFNNISMIQINMQKSFNEQGRNENLREESFHKYILKSRWNFKLTTQKVLIVTLMISNIYFLIYFSIDRFTSKAQIRNARKGTGKLWSISRADMQHHYEHHIEGLETKKPLVIAHRGASGVLPEHTPQAYQAAVDSGADVIECDAAVSGDGDVWCLHEAWMRASSDVASKFEAARMREYVVAGETRRDFFSVDFTSEEISSLQKVESRAYRNQQYNGLFPLATLKQMMQIAFGANRSVGIHVELKDPAFYNQHVPASASFEGLVVNEMLANGCQDRRTFRCFIQSFDLESLRRTRQLTNLPLLYLTKPPVNLSDSTLDELAGWLYGVAPRKDQIIGEEGATDLISRCHERGLRVHAYTFRNEHMYLPGSSSRDAYLEMATFFRLRLDAYFSDFPHSAHSFLAALYAYHR